MLVKVDIGVVCTGDIVIDRSPVYTVDIMVEKCQVIYTSKKGRLRSGLHANQ